MPVSAAQRAYHRRRQPAQISAGSGGLSRRRGSGWRRSLALNTNGGWLALSHRWQRSLSSHGIALQTISYGSSSSSAQAAAGSWRGSASASAMAATRRSALRHQQLWRGISGGSWRRNGTWRKYSAAARVSAGAAGAAAGSALPAGWRQAQLAKQRSRNKRMAAWLSAASKSPQQHQPWRQLKISIGSESSGIGGGAALQSETGGSHHLAAMAAAGSINGGGGSVAVSGSAALCSGNSGGENSHRGVSALAA